MFRGRTILEERGYLDKCIKFEETKGREYLYNAVSKLLRLTNDDNLIVNKIVAELEAQSIKLKNAIPM